MAQHLKHLCRNSWLLKGERVIMKTRRVEELLQNQFDLSSSMTGFRGMSNLPENAVYGGPKPQSPWKRITLNHLTAKYEKGNPITMVTAYDYPSAVHVDMAGIDICLVGDSVGMVVHGHDTTLPVTMEDMLLHCRAVARGASRPLLVGDLPFGSYEESKEQAVASAARMLKEGGMDAIKLEGGTPSRVTAARAIVEAGIAVMGHVGLTPQAISVLGGFRPQGRNIASATKVLESALALQDAGCFSIVLECVPSPVAAAVTSSLRIPTIGIGAGPNCGGQVAETRFASHTIVLRRLVKVKEALSQMVISNQWSIWKQSSTVRAQKVKALVLDDDWWTRVEYVLEFTDPIMSMLRFADTDLPCLGDIYDSMDTMLEKIKMVIHRRENDPEDTLYKKVEAMVLHRWNKMTTPLHLLAYALSPRYYSAQVLGIPGRVAPYRDAEVASGYKKAFDKIFRDPDIGVSVRREFRSFISGRDLHPTAINDQSKMDAITWWYLHGQDYLYLQPLAIKILSQVLVYHDLLQMMQHPHHAQVTPKFCKHYGNIGAAINEALSKYRDEVVSKNFPSAAYTPYTINQPDLEGFITELRKRGLNNAATAAAAASENDNDDPPIASLPD